MNTLERLQLLELFIGAGFLMFAYVYMYQKTRLDAFREDIFTIRDRDLFDYMWKNGLPYDLPAYQKLRDFIHGLIRTAPWARPGVVLVLDFLVRHHHVQDNIQKLIGEIPDELHRAHFQKVYLQLRHRARRYLFLEGIAWLIFKPIELFVKRQQPTDRLVEELVRIGEKNSPEARQLHQLRPILSR